MKKLLNTEVERNSKIDTLRSLHLNFNHDKFVSYDKRSLPHSSAPDECGKLRLSYETNLS